MHGPPPFSHKDIQSGMHIRRRPLPPFARSRRGAGLTWGSRAP